jgi:hypothetical protein
MSECVGARACGRRGRAGLAGEGARASAAEDEQARRAGVRWTPRTSRPVGEGSAGIKQVCTGSRGGGAAAGERRRPAGKGVRIDDWREGTCQRRSDVRAAGGRRR